VQTHPLSRPNPTGLPYWRGSRGQHASRLLAGSAHVLVVVEEGAPHGQAVLVVRGAVLEHNVQGLQGVTERESVCVCVLGLVGRLLSGCKEAEGR
jgi:hypothetical protein